MHYRLKHTTAIAVLAILLMACKGEKQPTVEPRVIEDVNPVTGVVSLRDYSYSDTITIAGRTYNYTCALEHVDTMPVLVNTQGTEYLESRVHIAIRQGDSKIFDKTFYKNTFRDIVPTEFLKTSTMVGVNYDITKYGEDHAALYFIVTVGDPDETSDMVFPLELKVMPDGSFSFTKAENLETGPLSAGLNVDPGENAI